MTFQQIISQLSEFWQNQGCAVLQPLDLEVGAGTFHPTTFFKALGPEPWRGSYVQPCRRPSDGRYGDNPNRLQHYYQFQVIIKPALADIKERYLKSLALLGIDPLTEDLRFVEDNWESPSLGAWGVGWEVWLNGMEITQFTYFQQVGGISCDPISIEITYGLERIAMYLQGVDSVYDLVWSNSEVAAITYGDLFLVNEQQMSKYNFELAKVEELLRQFSSYEEQAKELTNQGLFIPAYELALKASQVFNLLDARAAISVTERQSYILKLRTITKTIAEKYLEHEAAQS